MTFAITVGARSAIVMLSSVEDHRAKAPPFAVGILAVQGFDSVHAVLKFSLDGDAFVEIDDDLRGTDSILSRDEFRRRIDMQAGLVGAFADALGAEFSCRPVPAEVPRAAAEAKPSAVDDLIESADNESASAWERVVLAANADPELRSYLITCAAHYESVTSNEQHAAESAAVFGITDSQEKQPPMRASRRRGRDGSSS